MPKITLQTLMCVLPQRLARIHRATSLRMQGLRVVLDGIEDPGNRAAVIRSAEAMGLLHIHVIHPPGGPIEGGKTAPNRAISTGSQKWVHLQHHSNVGSCVELLRTSGFKIYTAKPENPGDDVARCPVPLQDLDFGHKTALVFGNERLGISEEMSKLADGDFTIQMFGLTESLNISVAAAICMHWGRQARQRAIGAETDLSEAEQSLLLEQYLVKSSHFQKKMKLDSARTVLTKEERRQMWEAATNASAEMAARVTEEAETEAELTRRPGRSGNSH